MRRREFIAAISAAVAWPPAVRAQQPEHMRRIGVLSSFAADDADGKARLAAFHQELERLGWSQRNNLHIDYRFAAATIDQYVPLAKELVALQPEVILAQSTQITASLQQITSAVPIVFTNVSDPIGSGFIASLARPGGNLTGLLNIEAGIMGKWLAMLREIAPQLTRVGLIGNPETTPFDYFLHAAEVAASPLAIKLVPIPVENVDADIERKVRRSPPRPAVWLCHPTRLPLSVAILSSRLRPAINCPPFMRSACLSPPVGSWPMRLIRSRCIGWRRAMSIAFCAARNRLTFRCRRRPDTKQ